MPTVPCLGGAADGCVRCSRENWVSEERRKPDHHVSGPFDRCIACTVGSDVKSHPVAPHSC